MIIEQNPIFDTPMVQSFLQAFAGSMFSVVITDANRGQSGQKILFANQVFLQQTGYSEEELRGQSLRILQGPKTSRALLDRLKAEIYQGQTFVGQTTNYRKDGSEYLVRWSINPLYDKNRKIIAFISCQLELSHRVTEEQHLKLLSEALNQAHDPMLITDLQGEILFANHAVTRLTGYTNDELIGRHTRTFQSGKMDEAFYQAMWQSLLNNVPYEGVFLNIHKDGHPYFEHKTITPIVDENHRPVYFLAISRDVTESVHKTDYLEYHAFHDPLTGLLNRAKFYTSVDEKIDRFVRYKDVFCLLIGDVDDFKKINDRFGHEKGDQVLKAVALQLHSSLRKDDVVARWGGEEFAILLESDIEASHKVAQMLLNKISQLKLDGVDITLSLSFGVAQIKEGELFKQLYTRADQALYQAKAEGKNCVRLATSDS